MWCNISPTFWHGVQLDTCFVFVVAADAKADADAFSNGGFASATADAAAFTNGGFASADVDASASSRGGRASASADATAFSKGGKGGSFASECSVHLKHRYILVVNQQHGT
jgi:hypothetical protein